MVPLTIIIFFKIQELGSFILDPTIFSYRYIVILLYDKHI